PSSGGEPGRTNGERPSVDGRLSPSEGEHSFVDGRPSPSEGDRPSVDGRLSPSEGEPSPCEAESLGFVRPGFATRPERPTPLCSALSALSAASLVLPSERLFR